MRLAESMCILLCDMMEFISTTKYNRIFKWIERITIKNVWNDVEEVWKYTVIKTLKNKSQYEMINEIDKTTDRLNASEYLKLEIFSQ